MSILEMNSANEGQLLLKY